MLRLRVGVLLIIISWLPIAQLSLWVAHNNGKLQTEEASTHFRLSVWTIQILIGFIGVWLVGKLAVQAARQNGVKKTPTELWRLFKSGGTS